MRELGVDDVAIAAGTTTETVEALVEHGVVSKSELGTFRPSDVRRARLALALQTSGIPLEALGNAIGEGRLSFDFIEELAPEPIPLLPETHHQLVARLGIPPDLATSLGTILGTCSLPADSQVRADHAELFELVAGARAEGAMDERITRVVHATAEAMRRVIDAQRDFVEETLLNPAAEAGATPSEVLNSTAAKRKRYRDIGHRSVELLLARFIDEATFQSVIETMETTLAADRVASHGVTPAIAFMDMSGYTRLAEEAGDEEAAAQAGRFTDAVQAVASGSGGRVVKVLGDGVMMHFPDPTTAVLGAVDLLARVHASGLPPARAGINTGPMVRRDGDYFGSVVNIAARAADYAQPFEILVTQDVVDSWDSRERLHFKAIGAVALKNVKRRIELFQVLPDEPR